jgi:hypothetical protein
MEIDIGTLEIYKRSIQAKGIQIMYVHINVLLELFSGHFTFGCTNSPPTARTCVCSRSLYIVGWLRFELSS